jgi:ABC-2 type transport system ATP-binding protein
MHLSARDVHKTYRSIPALIGVNLEVGPGQAYALLGRNGAGKTTLLDILGGLIRPDSGTITFDGQALTVEAISVRRRLGILPERDSTLPDLTGQQYLEFVTIVRGLKPFTENAPARELSLRLLESEDVFSQLVETYSQGMRKKLAIAAALISEPEFILLDEPFSNLDPVSCSVLTELLRGFTQRGIPIVVSSHILGPVEALATHIGVIDQGRMLKTGPLLDFIDQTGSMERSLLTTLGIELGHEAH